MRRNIAISILFAVLAVLCLSSCADMAGSNFKPFKGPTGGWVFYDCDADNDSGNADGLRSEECGWRYLEAAPADLRIVDGVPSIDSSSSAYKQAAYTDCEFYFCFYKKNLGADPNYYVNGTTVYNASDCTGTAIGTGKKNTELLVNAMGADGAYAALSSAGYSGNTSTKDYSANLCARLSFTVGGKTYDDWFLPSKDELELINNNLFKANLGGLLRYEYYWSSSESNYAEQAWLMMAGHSKMISSRRGDPAYIRPIRAYL